MSEPVPENKIPQLREEEWLRKEARHQALRQVWENTVCNDRGETNAQRELRELTEEKLEKLNQIIKQLQA